MSVFANGQDPVQQLAQVSVSISQLTGQLNGALPMIASAKLESKPILQAQISTVEAQVSAANDLLSQLATLVAAIQAAPSS